MKTCTRCKITKEPGEFYRDARARDGKTTRCKTCMSDYRREHRTANAEWWKEKTTDTEWIERRRAAGRAYVSRNPGRHHNITAALYIALSEAQSNVCAICKRPETKISRHGTVMRLAVDHDHECCPGPRSCGNCIRGLLCGNCNQAIGLLRESRAYIAEALIYIIRNQNVDKHLQFVSGHSLKIERIQ